MTNQCELQFDGGGTDQGYRQWLALRQMTARDLAVRLGLPLGHPVEVWLVGGVRLRGTLRLREELLFVEEENLRHLELMVDHVGFLYREMESCVRLD